ncbi:MAG TPA: hypothetical protein DEA08_36125 [Planctomycetes bacterium]|nr:hypothetical protein [Planctomycetota bacterium]
MTDPSEPPTRDEDLERWLEAEGPPPEDLAAFRASEALLQRASPLNRASCPSPAELIAAPEELGVTLSAARQRHLAACPLCADDLADYEVYQQIEASPLAQVAAALQGKLVLALDAAQAVLRLLESSLPSAEGLTLAPVRGGEGAAPTLVQRGTFGQGSLELEWAAARGTVDLRIQVDGQAPRPYRVDLHAGGEEPGGLLESRSCDESGQVHLAGLTPGSYWLRVQGPHDRSPALELALELGSVGD